MFLGYDPQRIGLQTEWLIEFIKTHKRNHPDAKFKIGDKVLYSNLDIVHKPITCKILAVNVQAGGLIIDDEIIEKPTVEYAITNVYGSLVWEDELKEVKG
jgi:hypothetical protein